MKVKIKKGFKTAKGEIKKGEILNVTPFAGEKWINEGLAQEVK
jgi:hypothetical protein